MALNRNNVNIPVKIKQEKRSDNVSARIPCSTRDILQLLADKSNRSLCDYVACLLEQHVDEQVEKFNEQDEDATK